MSTLSRLLLVLLLAAPAMAAMDTTDVGAPGGKAVRTEEDDMAMLMRNRIETDPEAAEALAARIWHSSLRETLSESEDDRTSYGDIVKWVNENPKDASSLAVGFAKDDARGSNEFEKSLSARIKRFFELNPDRGKGLLGVLGRAADESKLISAMKDADDEDRREMIKKFFEGRGAGKGKLGMDGSDGGSGKRGEEQPDDPTRTAAFAGDGLYDRLSAANPTGFSPQVMAFQSEMNRRRAPGAPRLIETGQLDYPTLRYPYFGLSHDAKLLSRNYASQRAWAQARGLGKDGQLSTEQYHKPEVRAALDKEAGGKDPDPSFKTRREMLARLDALLAGFEREAAKTRKRSSITPGRIRRLSSIRRDAARWIAAASLEEKLYRLRTYRGFLTPPLSESIKTAPADARTRALYIERGRRLAKTLEATIRDGEKAVLLLTSPSGTGLAEAVKLISRVQGPARRLPREIDRYREAPGRLHKARRSVTGIRAWIDGWVVRLLPSSGYARRVKRELKDEEEALKLFTRVASARD